MLMLPALTSCVRAPSKISKRPDLSVDDSIITHSTGQFTLMLENFKAVRLKVE